MIGAAVRQHLLDALRTSPSINEPFPHTYVTDTFPDTFYSRLIASLPPAHVYVPLRDTGRVRGPYPPQRTVIFLNETDALARIPEATRPLWAEMQRWLTGPAVVGAVLERFRAEIAALVNAASVSVYAEVQLVRDYPGYAIGPHTDVRHELAAMVMYLALDSKRPWLGTSLYVPRNQFLTCEGGPHYGPEAFVRESTLDYSPNRLFAFPKTNRCFHGVERFDEPDAVRDVLLWMVYRA